MKIVFFGGGFWHQLGTQNLPKIEPSWDQVACQLDKTSMEAEKAKNRIVARLFQKIMVGGFEKHRKIMIFLMIFGPGGMRVALEANIHTCKKPMHLGIETE